MLSLYIGTAVNQQKLYVIVIFYSECYSNNTNRNMMLGKAVETLSNQKAIKLTKRELITFAPSEYCDFSKLSTLNLSHNCIRHFPKHIMLLLSLVSLCIFVCAYIMRIICISVASLLHLVYLTTNRPLWIYRITKSRPYQRRFLLHCPIYNGWI
jgi:hypothetical protein